MRYREEPAALRPHQENAARLNEGTVRRRNEKDFLLTESMDREGGRGVEAVESCVELLDFASKVVSRVAQGAAGLPPGTASTVSCAIIQKKCK